MQLCGGALYYKCVGILNDHKSNIDNFYLTYSISL